MTDKAQIAVIGTGWWSTYTHIPGLQNNQDAALVAICDRDAARLDAAAEAYHIEQTYTDHRAMLTQEALDGVVIATNHASHFALARDCLENGLHVLLEKPMTLFAREALELVELARAQQRQLVVGYPYNYLPYAVRSQAIILSGELGQIQFINCVFCSNIISLLRGEHNVSGPVHGPGKVYSNSTLSGGGHGHLQMTHPLGLLYFITGLRARRVSAMMHKHGLALDLVDAMTVEFENGALASIGGTGNLGDGGGRKFDLQIFCENGSLDLDVCTGQAIIYRAEQPPEPIEPAISEADGYRRFHPANNLVDIILGRAENGSPADVGWRAVETLDAAYRSARQEGLPISTALLYKMG
jgi:predicted dehydrogenase